MIAVSRTSLMVGGFLSKALLALLVYLEEETVRSAVCCGNGVPLLLVYLASSPAIHDFVEVVLLFILLQLLLLLLLLLFLFYVFFFVVFLKDFCPEKYKALCKIMSSKFIKTGDASTMLESYLSVITKGSCSNDDNGLFLAKDFDPRMSYVASPISGKFTCDRKI